MIYSGFPLVEIFVADGRTNKRTAVFLEILADLKRSLPTVLLSISTFFASISHLLLFGLIS